MLCLVDRDNSRLGFGLSNGDCKSSSNIILGEEAPKSDEVPFAEPSGLAAEGATSPVPVSDPAQEQSESKGDAPAQAPKHQSKDKSSPKGTSIFGAEPKCKSATTCGACAAFDGDHCFWNSALSQCLVGDPSPLMCTLDALPKNLAVLIGLGVGGCILLIGCVACGVCAYKKRQSAAHEASVDAEEAFEARVPLAPDDDGRTRSFLRRDDDEMETF